MNAGYACIAVHVQGYTYAGTGVVEGVVELGWGLSFLVYWWVSNLGGRLSSALLSCGRFGPTGHPLSAAELRMPSEMPCHPAEWRILTATYLPWPITGQE